MLLKDIVSLLNEEARGAHVVSDERIDPRIWEAFIMLARNQFIKNHYNEKQYIELNTLQTEKLTLTPYDSTYDIGGVSIGNYIMRTEELPKMIEGRSGPAIYEIHTADISSRTMQFVPFDRLRWCGNGTTNRNVLYAAWYDNRIYVKSNSEIEKGIKYINVVAIFADPTEVSTFDEDTDDYPMNDYMIRYAKNLILTEDFKITSSTKSDEKNDSSGLIEER